MCNQLSKMPDWIKKQLFKKINKLKKMLFFLHNDCKQLNRFTYVISAETIMRLLHVKAAIVLMTRSAPAADRTLIICSRALVEMDY